MGPGSRIITEATAGIIEVERGGRVCQTIGIYVHIQRLFGDGVDAHPLERWPWNSLGVIGRNRSDYPRAVRSGSKLGRIFVVWISRQHVPHVLIERWVGIKDVAHVPNGKGGAGWREKICVRLKHIIRAIPQKPPARLFQAGKRRVIYIGGGAVVPRQRGFRTRSNDHGNRHHTNQK